MNHLAAILRATVTFYNPMAAPGEVWTRVLDAVEIGGPGNYTASDEDDEGRTWGLLFSIQPDNTILAASAILLAGVSPPPSGSISPAKILKPFPLDTGQLEADTISQAARITLRVTL